VKASTIRLAAAGKAYISVAQSSAIAIQDATDYLRSMSTISSTAAGIGIAMIIAGNPTGATVIQQAQQLGTGAVTQFSSICTAAITVATDFPSSFG
jgi:hypothetical protein